MSLKKYENPTLSVMSPAKDRLLLEALRLLPKNCLSTWMGHVTSMRWPKSLVRAEIALFAKYFGIDGSEMQKPFQGFVSLQDFFTRELKPGKRVIDGAAKALVSPCDGFWGQGGIVSQGQLLQIKGKQYSLATLLGDSQYAKQFENGDFVTFYLSPKDYHRFHAPCDCRVVEVIYLPGQLWPVNTHAVRSVDGLFSRNERIVIIFEVKEKPGTFMAIVAVGATMVGKIRLVFDDLTTNTARRHPVRKHYADAGVQFQKGDELGRFEFGSTLVMLGEEGALRIEFQTLGQSVRFGERVGTL